MSEKYESLLNKVNKLERLVLELKSEIINLQKVESSNTPSIEQIELYLVSKGCEKGTDQAEKIFEYYNTHGWSDNWKRNCATWIKKLKSNRPELFANKELGDTVRKEFLTLWELYPNHNNKNNAEQLYSIMRKANSIPDIDTLTNSIIKFKENYPWKDVKYIPFFENFLRRRIFEEYMSSNKTINSNKVVLTDEEKNIYLFGAEYFYTSVDVDYYKYNNNDYDLKLLENSNPELFNKYNETKNRFVQAKEKYMTKYNKGLPKIHDSQISEYFHHLKGWSEEIAFIIK